MKPLEPISEAYRAEALDAFTGRLRKLREAGFAEPRLVEAFRRRARAAKLEYLSRPAEHLARLADTVEANGGRVYFAADAAEARDQVLAICQHAGAGRVVKSKSMTCEEIELNPHLEEHGLTVTETDMGEFIVQLLGEPPFHILGPAMHRTRAEVSRLFSERFEPVGDEPAQLTGLARKVLRKRFLEAEVGISGVNAVACDTGTMAIITNEGNGRYCTSVPPVHIAVMGLEKAVPTTDDLALISTLLPRAALGWPISSYVSWTRAPAGRQGGQGPREFHLIILDNGRSRALDSEFWEILLCLRCSSCLNYCPVYTRAGGHAYRSVYCGPMGSVLTPLLRGQKGDRSLARASTLCGRCREMCPVGIDLPGLLLKLRQQEAEAGPARRLLPRLGAEVLSRRGPWEAAWRLARPITGLLRALPADALPPGPWRGWRTGRRLPRVPGGTLVGRRRRKGGGRG